MLITLDLKYREKMQKYHYVISAICEMYCYIDLLLLAVDYHPTNHNASINMYHSR